MTNKLLLLCQGLHKSKIIASILSYLPKDCILLRSFYDINPKVRENINIAINDVIHYIDSHRRFFQQLDRIWEVRVDIINPISVIKSLETIDLRTRFHYYEVVVDISAGPIPANVGLYLFALKYKIPSVHFSFPGERFQAQTSTQTVLEKLEQDIEFAKQYSFDIPITDVVFKEIDERVIYELSRLPTGQIGSLKGLNTKLGQETSGKHMMNLSREISRMAALNLIRTTRTRKLKEISLTSFGKQYATTQKYEKPSLELIWERN
ncbi:MAG: hypothetical protein ACFFFG_15630 [Candidatus Thorarchaeota archaeon]